MSDYVTLNELIAIKRPLSAAEQTRAEALIPLVCDAIRYEAQKIGKDFDEMLYNSELGNKIDKFTGNGVQSEFSLTDSACKLISVKVDGEEAEYIADGDKIEFVTAPASGAEIIVKYTFRILSSKAKAVTCDVIMRELNTPATQVPSTQYSESAGNVSQSYSIPNSSGRIALWNTDLKSLGLKRQKIGSIDMMR